MFPVGIRIKAYSYQNDPTILIFIIHVNNLVCGLDRFFFCFFFCKAEEKIGSSQTPCVALSTKIMDS